jgi:hypothetical protein
VGTVRGVPGTKDGILYSYSFASKMTPSEVVCVKLVV